MNEKLNDVLIEECDRLTEITDSEDVGSEAWEAAYRRKLDILEKMNAFNKVETEYFIKAEDRRVEEERNRKMLELEERKLAQHLEIERSRREGEIALEKEKQKLNWKRVSFEMAKILVPLGVTILVRRKEREEIFDFETHGRITSTVGRQFRLHDLFWKK